MRDIPQRVSLSYDLASDGWYKESVAHLLPEYLFVAIFNRWYADDSRIWRDSDGWWISDTEKNDAIALPRAMTAVRFSQKTISDRLSWVRDKYQLEGFVEVNEGDDIVDIGAFIGEFTMAVAPLANHILAIEPDPLNFAALRRTTEPYDQIRVTDDLLWGETDRIPFSVARDGSESSVSSPDRGKSSFHTIKKAKRLDAVVDPGIDFAKVEAEGSEVEIIEGFGDLRVPKIAVDCSEPSQAEGQTPEKRIRRLLEDQDYETKIVNKANHGTMLFGRAV